MEVKPGYKQTEMGVIPEQWEVKPLGGIAELKNGYAFKSETYTSLGDFKVVTIANVQDGFMETGECDRILIVPRDAQAHHRLKLKDILISMTGNVGRVCRVNENNCLLNQRVGKLVPTDIDDGLLFLLLSQRKFLAAMALKAKGGAQGNLSVSDITEFQFPVPATEDEQRAIAEALSDVDGLLGGLDRLIAKKRDLKQAAMQQLLTGQTRLPGFHGEWEVKTVSDVCWFQEGPGVRNTQFTSTGVKLLNGTNIFRGRINLDTTDRFISNKEAHGAYAHFLADSGDIVIACSGISVEKFHEKVAVVIQAHLPFCMNTSTMRFKPRQEHLVRDYFCHFLMGDSFKRQIAPQATGSAQLNFGPSHVEKVELPLPSLHEQTAIAEVLTEMDAELSALEQRREKTRALKQAMMQELLTGRTRLI